LPQKKEISGGGAEDESKMHGIQRKKQEEEQTLTNKVNGKKISLERGGGTPTKLLRRCSRKGWGRKKKSTNELVE